MFLQVCHGDWALDGAGVILLFPNKKFTMGAVLRPYLQVLAQFWKTVLVPALAYVGDYNDVLQWSAKADPVLVFGAGTWYSCDTVICRV